MRMRRPSNIQGLPVDRFFALEGTRPYHVLTAEVACPPAPSAGANRNGT